MEYHTDVHRSGLFRWEWSVADAVDPRHVWFGHARSRRDAEDEADRVRRQLEAVDLYSMWLVRPPEPSRFLDAS